MGLTDRFNRWLVQIAADIRDEHERRTKADEERKHEEARQAAEAELEKKLEKQREFEKLPFLLKTALGWSPPVCIDLAASKQYEDDLSERDQWKAWKANEFGFNWAYSDDSQTEMHAYDRRQQAQEALAVRLALQGRDASVIAPAVGWSLKETKEFLKTRRVQ